MCVADEMARSGFSLGFAQPDWVPQVSNNEMFTDNLRWKFLDLNCNVGLLNDMGDSVSQNKYTHVLLRLTYTSSFCSSRSCLIKVNLAGNMA